MKVDVINEIKAHHSNKLWSAEVYSPEGGRWLRIGTGSTEQGAMRALVKFANASAQHIDPETRQWRVMGISW